LTKLTDKSLLIKISNNP